MAGTQQYRSPFRYPYIRGWGSFTLDRLHRWSVGRTWVANYEHYVFGSDLPHVLFVVLHATPADRENDALTDRCMRLAHSWGYQSMEIRSLFSLVARSERQLFAAKDKGPFYRSRLQGASREAALTVAAWGDLPHMPAVLERRNEVLSVLHKPHHLGLTATGHPMRPQDVKAGVRPQPLNHA